MLVQAVLLLICISWIRYLSGFRNIWNSFSRIIYCYSSGFQSLYFDVPVNITQPLPPLSGSITSQTDVACFGTSTGSVTVQGSGGLAPYEYSLNGGVFQVSGTFGTLASGNYTVTIRDATLNTFDVAVTITQPSSALGGSIYFPDKYTMFWQQYRKCNCCRYQEEYLLTSINLDRFISGFRYFLITDCR